jgi:hypothetical protein
MAALPATSKIKFKRHATFTQPKQKEKKLYNESIDHFFGWFQSGT